MRKKTKYNLKFDEFIFNNRWKMPAWQRTSNWVILGLSTSSFDENIEYQISFFGLDFRFWFVKELNEKK